MRTEDASIARPRESDPRAELIAHVRAVQRSIRSCTGCGLCCTVAHNSVQILPIEGRRIAGWIEGLGVTDVRVWKKRLRRTIRRFRLRPAAAANYTCTFLGPDFRCALPFDVKPVACLSFNPIEAERCDQDASWYARVHAPVAAQNAEEGRPEALSPIPVTVIGAWERRDHGEP